MPSDDGNGAREALARYFRDYDGRPLVQRSVAPDHLLTWLAIEGFVVVPMRDPELARDA